MTVQIKKATLEGLRKGFVGEIILAGDSAYDDARTIFNAMSRRRSSADATLTLRTSSA
jgi:hypothetical protein